ncbi:MAG TPA: hypothetical protein VHH73_03750 [Verrucomicrobiae bacterium]|nr:hypothetical protein [Verrucomicrobiae bacterium]
MRFTKLRLGLALMAGVAMSLSGCHPGADSAKPIATEKDKEKGKEPKSGPGVVRLEAEAVKKIGLQTETLKAAKFTPELKAYGQVLDPTPLAATVAELIPAMASAQNSRQEFERLTELHAQDNASTRALQAADLAAKRDQLAVEAALTRATLAWGKRVTSHPDLPGFVQSLVSLENALVRADLPAGQMLKEPPARALIFTLQESAPPLAGEFFSEAPMVDPQSQGQGFFFLVRNPPTSLRPGATITATVPAGGEASQGVWIPRAAILRVEGKAWVYEAASETEFHREEVNLEHPGAQGWFVTGDLKAGDKVVTTGAALLWSEETKARNPAE